KGLRERLEMEIAKLDDKPNVIIPPMKLCGDNAAMIGAAAYNLYKAGKFSGLDLNADPSLELPYADAILDR
ncbi:MAG: tRNA (adenosine(37)-N6)-threonylcarbamoyltransferase complex transferase subunit TsaD, partial [Lactobacillus crispatus]|nr:tRNA (adenosine(37)-N6)-threonylcarbamoyltransferase complex transferase subunit TsaD [Lactobacillus crispatus]